MGKSESVTVQYEQVWVDEKNQRVSFHALSDYELHFFETHDEMIRYVLHLVTHGYGIL